jgi:hypothetical protein
VVRVEVGNLAFWGRLASILRGLLEQSDGFLAGENDFYAKMSGRYFQKCANVRYPLPSLTQRPRNFGSPRLFWLHNGRPSTPLRSPTSYRTVGVHGGDHVALNQWLDDIGLEAFCASNERRVLSNVC